ncbi:PQQ-binding-like beta-propeller repeat protein [Natrialbaceae archaeon AArc-T1-2]|uniref:outer membrane protein assembly factor BamB family protein n=1 Tax=Natrialbaceae archaeon AArc-T1-2 TaxID=3053904 RepID=UPI00255AC6BB|nr:PQQ-binding-like beta-propeller repeat protein [Natrialbaceae archaeon AArc-T1-2]WIV66124.1 PQQ-binding-like beta-propeller repeat protein [Natrialbaceae archaeon AArc-T1-2]
MDRRSFCAVTGVALSAGCLQLQEAETGDGSGDETEDEPPAETAPSEGVQSVTLTEAFTLEDRLRATFSHEGSFWGFVDHRLQAVGPDGTLEWESDSVGDDVSLVPSTLLAGSEVGGSCVAFSPDRVFAGGLEGGVDTGRDERATLYAFDRETGTLEWEDAVERPPEYVRPLSATTVADVVVAAIDVGSGSDDEPWVLRALEVDTGESRWEESLEDVRIQHILAHDETLFVSTDDGLLEFDPESGSQTGTVDVTALPPHASPTDDVLCCATLAGIERVDLATGEIEWIEDRERPIGSLAADDASVYGIDHAGYVTALDRGTGEQRWESRLPIENVRNGGFVSSGDVLWASGNDGSLYGLAAADGELLYDESHHDYGFHLGAIDDVLLTSSSERGFVTVVTFGSNQQSSVASRNPKSSFKL